MNCESISNLIFLDVLFILENLSFEDKSHFISFDSFLLLTTLFLELFDGSFGSNLYLKLVSSRLSYDDLDLGVFHLE